MAVLVRTWAVVALASACTRETTDANAFAAGDVATDSETAAADLGLDTLPAPDSADVVDASDTDTAEVACLGTPPCNDQNPCTVDLCVPGAGCQHAEAGQGATCEDGDLCTTSDGCAGRVCKAGKPVACLDNNPCTDDACSKTAGCVFTNNVLPCNDGDKCTTVDACTGGNCKGTAPNVCIDGDPCTGDYCDKDKGCIHPAQAGTCTDGNACTDGDACAGGACKPGPPKVCDDQNPCTMDACDPKTGCTAAPLAGTCDDGLACTIQDACSGGTCKGKEALFKLTFGTATATETGFAVAAGPYGYAVAASGSKQGGKGFGKDDFWLYRADPTGLALDPLNYGTTGDDVPYGLVNYPGGGWVLAGETTADATKDALVVRTDKDGAPLWQKAYGESSLSEWARAVAVGNNTVIAGGKLVNSSSDLWVALVLKYDGVLAWQATYALAQSYDEARAVWIDATGVTAAGFGYTENGATTQGLVVRFDNGGVLAWATPVGGSDSKVVFNAVTRLDDGTYFAAGSHLAPASVYKDVFAARLDGNGNVLWAKQYKTPEADDALAMVATGSNAVVLGGHRVPDSGTLSDMLLMQLDTGGEIVWQQVIGEPGSLEDALGIAYYDGRIATSGIWKANKNQPNDALLMVTDAFGHVSCTGAGLCAAKAKMCAAQSAGCNIAWCSAKNGCKTQKDSGCD
jgi:hypothetical protein